MPFIVEGDNLRVKEIEATSSDYVYSTIDFAIRGLNVCRRIWERLENRDENDSYKIKYIRDIFEDELGGLLK